MSTTWTSGKRLANELEPWAEMSIELSLFRLKKAQWTRLKKDPENPFEFLYGAGQRRSCDLGNEWQAIHYLLTSCPDLAAEHVPDNPLTNAVLGGHETDAEVRYLEPNEVKAIARALAKISAGEIRNRYSAEEFNDEEIYPSGDGWTEGEGKFLAELYAQLARFYKSAAAAGEVVLIFKS
jgi:hypothetical protein